MLQAHGVYCVIEMRIWDVSSISSVRTETQLVLDKDDKYSYTVPHYVQRECVSPSSR